MDTFERVFILVFCLAMWSSPFASSFYGNSNTGDMFVGVSLGMIALIWLQTFFSDAHLNELMRHGRDYTEMTRFFSRFYYAEQEAEVWGIIKRAET